MKKVLAILLSMLMLMSFAVPMASAEDATDPSAETAKVILDWVDAQIADVTADFQQFNEYTDITGITVPSDLDGILAYKDYIAQLGGDFANLDTSALNKTRAADGDIALINSIIDFMAANKAIFGKVFTWKPEGTPFNYGKVGEYIESLEDGNEIKTFYTDYLKDGFDIQTKFISEIAREMGYTVPEGEDFDVTLNKGIKGGKIGSFLRSLLKKDANLATFDAYDLRTANVYDLVKDYIGLLQDEYKDGIDNILAPIVEGIASAIEPAKEIATKFGENPPEMTIGYTGNDPYATYTPASANMEDYMPNIYVNDTAKATMDQAFGSDENIDVLKNSEMTEADKALVATAGTAWGKDVIVNATVGGEKILDNLTIDLKSVEDAAIAAIETAVNGKGFEVSGVSATISDAKATFDYTMFSDADSFAAQVAVKSATAKATFSGSFNGFPVSGTADVDLVNPDNTVVSGVTVMGFDVSQFAQSAAISAIKAAVGDMFADPAFATVVVNNLSGEIEGLDELNTLLGYIKSDINYDYSLLDVITEYDAYKGVVGQANRILVDAAKMIFTDAGIAYLGLEEGGNDKLDSNIDKIITKAGELVAKAQDALAMVEELKTSNPAIAEFLEGIEIPADIDLGVLSNFNFASKEALFVSAINYASTLDLGSALPEEVADILALVKDEKTLDDMLIAVINEYAPQIKLPEGCGYTFTAIAKGGDARENIGKEAAKAVFAGANWAIDVANDAATKLVQKFDEDMTVSFDLGVDYDAADWEGSLDALVDRFVELTDGLFIKKFDTSKDAIPEAADILYEVLPLDSMFSNVKSGADVAALDETLFNDVLNGNFSDFLALFEVKEDAVAGGTTSVTKALINASERIVKAFFPTTVSAANYEQSETVQEYFTSYANDPEIAARNMQDIADRKADLVPFALNLAKESGALQAICAHTGDTETVKGKDATCTAEGYTDKVTCTVCGKVINDVEVIPAKGHTPVTVAGKAPTCTEKGLTDGSKCSVCGDTITAQTEIPAKGHTDANGDNLCDDCGATISNGSSDDNGDNGGNNGGISGFFGKIRDFFQRIINWFRNLFKR